MIYLCVLYRNDGTDDNTGEVNEGSDRLLVAANSHDDAATVALDHWHDTITALDQNGYEPGIGTNFAANTLLSFEPNRMYKE